MKNAAEIPELEKDHPLNLYNAEKRLILTLLEDLKSTNPGIEKQRFYNVFNHLQTIERRFERKENQLFPYLEKQGWDSRTQRMWSFHDTLRAQFKILRTKLDKSEPEKIIEDTNFLINGIHRLLEMEEKELFPRCLNELTEDDWNRIKSGENEIGWMFKTTKEFSSKEAVSGMIPNKNNQKKNSSHYDEGSMTVEQVNLLFKTMPLDITYVDENDRVIFYNRGEERLFPRSPGIIGREVQFCHPPKSVGTVLKILEEFKKGTRTEASFWINIRERLIYIRYFAVRDDKKKYRGVVEISQDITEIKNITGEKRLLDWN